MSGEEGMSWRVLYQPGCRDTNKIQNAGIAERQVHTQTLCCVVTLGPGRACSVSKSARLDASAQQYQILSCHNEARKFSHSSRRVCWPSASQRKRKPAEAWLSRWRCKLLFARVAKSRRLWSKTLNTAAKQDLNDNKQPYDGTRQHTNL